MLQLALNWEKTEKSHFFFKSNLSVILVSFLYHILVANYEVLLISASKHYTLQIPPSRVATWIPRDIRPPSSPLAWIIGSPGPSFSQPCLHAENPLVQPLPETLRPHSRCLSPSLPRGFTQGLLDARHCGAAADKASSFLRSQGPSGWSPHTLSSAGHI